ncbi:glycosyltransferase involved in cell wall biosynthesis [Planomicrobium soli]|uniref:Glycosyltransferase involved in cell wall biosynthesis n=1 Tax=Planomicrobium soli TaxID=1176648 RepID=A0A2P8H3B5_9BACL|nr:glycosyltransferase family 4 protein [Planomicrobium soli]PSL40697.1 glycosyltransferase involved in cell wall biosynthesis [Planomicrobium soli]
MEVLHICSYYIGSKIYKNLVKELSQEGIKQHIFIPIKNEKLIGENELLDESININYYYKTILKKHDKYLYHNKINKQMKEIEKNQILDQDIDYIHAHTIFSDGGTAYKIKRKYNIDYAVAVRDTDINVFYKYAIHLRPFMNKILLNANKIVFISYAYKNLLFSLLPKNILSEIEKKCVVIPNGIDNFWHNIPVENHKRNNGQALNLLFMGSLIKRKNLETLIFACSELYKEGYNVFLQVIGNGPLEEESKNLCQKLNISEKVRFHGYINDKEKIRSIMDKCDIFILPSLTETFGLVYVEAMSRGIPVIYSQNQAIDGFFNEGEVGFGVPSLSPDMIVNAIKKINENYVEISQSCIEKSKLFNWNIISRKYIEIYNGKL